jgi:branched-chain amino acid transport system permease protein
LLPQILLAGLVVGSCYSIVSVGMTILFQATTVLNFAHGECVMIGGFVFFTLQIMYGVSYPYAILLTIVICLIMGGLMDRLVFKRIVHAPHINVVLATCGFLYFLKGIARVIWKSEPRFPPPFIDVPPITLFGAIITSQDIVILVSVFILTAFFVWIFLFTDAGLRMRAAAQSLKGASLIGINTERLFTKIWAVSVATGAFAGILLGPIYSIYPDVGESFLLRAFAAMTLGGFGNIGGAAVGGLIMGLVENLVGLYIWTPLKEIVAYVVIVFVLLIKPTGIMGVRKF